MRQRISCLEWTPWAVALFLAMMIGAATVLQSCGTTATDEDLRMWQDSATILREEIQESKRELASIEDPFERAGMQAKIERMERFVIIFDDALQSAEDELDAKFAFGEAAIGAIGGFFPPALLAMPWIRTLRRQRHSIFKAVAAGGGVVNKAEAKAVLATNPAAVVALAKFKAGNDVPVG